MAKAEWMTIIHSNYFSFPYSLELEIYNERKTKYKSRVRFKFNKCSAVFHGEQPGEVKRPAGGRNHHIPAKQLRAHRPRISWQYKTGLHFNVASYPKRSPRSKCNPLPQGTARRPEHNLREVQRDNSLHFHSKRGDSGLISINAAD